MAHHLAQLNIARTIAPADSPQLKDFMDNIDRINALADDADGFVWRLQDDNGSATDIRIEGDDWLLVNMSVWESVDALYQYTYYSGHVEIFRRRHEWFEVVKEPMMVMWWIPAGHIPTVEEAFQRLEMLREKGPTPDAFTFKQRFESTGQLSAGGE